MSGHKGVVTGVQFMNKHNLVVASSKDTYIKFWDLTTGHCFKTLAGHITEARFIYEYSSKCNTKKHVFDIKKNTNNTLTYSRRNGIIE
ncbi:hypothetical protein QTP88_028556 [Uroleucon formosanum]